MIFVVDVDVLDVVSEDAIDPVAATVRGAGTLARKEGSMAQTRKPAARKPAASTSKKRATPRTSARKG